MEAEERAAKPGNSERVEKLEKELEKLRLEKVDAETEAKRWREEKDQAVRSEEQITRSREGILDVSRKRELEMGTLQKENAAVDVELAKVRKEVSFQSCAFARRVFRRRGHDADGSSFLLSFVYLPLNSSSPPMPLEQPKSLTSKLAGRRRSPI